MQAPVCPGPDPRPRTPRHTIPKGVVDCHCHVFPDPQRYPLSPNRSYTPALTTLDDYLAMCAVVGIERTIQVNASTYGTDNSVSLDVIKTLGLARARGVAGVAPDVSAQDLRTLHDGGMRGVRLSTKVKGYGGTELIQTLAPKIKPYGWHVQLHVENIQELVALESKLLHCPVPLVFDHQGRVRGDQGVSSPGFQALLRIISARNDCWVKLSSWYRLSGTGLPDCVDMKPIIQALVATRPDRLVWGTNWPHPLWHGLMPNDGGLIDQLCDWVTDPNIQQQILVSNPEQLYGFV